MQLVFTSWVERYGGVNVLAEKLQVTEHTVRVWLRGEGPPKSETIMDIIKISKGELSFQDIFKETTRSQS